MRNLIILIGIIFILGACGSSTVEGPSTPKKVVEVPKANFENKQEIEKTNIIHIDLRNKKSVWDMLNRSTFISPVPWDMTKPEEVLAYKNAVVSCEMKQQKLRQNRFQGFPDVNTMLYGRHPEHLSAFLCLGDKATKFKMRAYCKQIDATLLKYDDVDYHTFSCKLNQGKN